MNTNKYIKLAYEILEMLYGGGSIFKTADNFSDILSTILTADKIFYNNNKIAHSYEQNVRGVNARQLRELADSIKAMYSKYGSEFIANLIFNVSQMYVPVDTGRLKKSGRVEKENNKYRIVYDTPYAIYVHEIMENAHTFPGRAKYLEDAAYEVLNYSQFGNEKPLFTFKCYSGDNGSIILEIDTIDVSEFIANKGKRDALKNLSWDELD